MNATIVRGDDGGLHVRGFASLADSIAACAAHDTGEHHRQAARSGWVAHHREIYSTLCPDIPPTREGISGHFDLADSHAPKLVRGIQF